MPEELTELLKGAKDMRDPLSVFLNSLYVSLLQYRDEHKRKAEEIERILEKIDKFQEQRKKELDERD